MARLRVVGILVGMLVGVLGTCSAARAACPAGSTCFAFTGTEQRYTVPAGVNQIAITAVGAHGGSR
jgi:hypothetical protein